MKLQCPSCDTEEEFVSNLDMERTYKWVWRRWHGEERLLCPGCSREGEAILEEYDRRGAKVSRRST